MKHYDTTIIGGGPAGTICGYELAKKGLKVALIDKNFYNRDKPCGGGISRYALNEIPFSIPSSVIEQKLKGIVLISPKNELYIKKEEKTLGITVKRSIFDTFLLKQAINAGIDFFPNMFVKKINKNGKTFVIEHKLKCKILVGADGANSIVGKLFTLGPNTNNCVGLRTYFHFSKEDLESFVISKNFIELYFLRNLNGYAWIFPLKNCINLGIGVIGNTRGIKQLLNNFIKIVFKLRKKPVTDYSVKGHPIPLFPLKGKITKDRILLIGDAAGLVDPISGEGIHFAIRSGRIAANNIINTYNRNLLPNQLSENYSNDITKNILRKINIANQIKNRFIDPIFVPHMDFCFNLLKQNPFLMSYFKELALTNNYYNVMMSLFKTSPLRLTETLHNIGIGKTYLKKIETKNPNLLKKAVIID